MPFYTLDDMREGAQKGNPTVSVHSAVGEFMKVAVVTKPEGKGTGLGLSVVSGLAKSWGGTATVESTEGVRTCFTIHLPLAEQQMQAAQ